MTLVLYRRRAFTTKVEASGALRRAFDKTGNPEIIPGRLVGSDLRTWHRFWADYGQTFPNPIT